MRIRPRGAAEDCCCSSLNDKVKWLMEHIGGTVRKLIINGNEYTPDGDGTVTLDTSAFVDVDDHLDDDSMKPIANKPVAEAVQSLSDADSVLDGKITSNTGAIEDLEDDVETLEASVQGQGSQISDLQGSIAGLAADNSYTRGLAQAAKDTADGMAERLTDLETNDTVQQSQIGQLILADQASAKLAGDNAFTGNNSFAVNPKAAAPASGAVDTSVVNANWASQTGVGKPNNLLHDTGMEVNISGLKDFVQLSRVGQHFRLTGTNKVEICRCAIVTDTTIYLMVNSRSSGSLFGNVRIATNEDNVITAISKTFTGIDLTSDVAKIYAYIKDNSVIIALGNDTTYNNFYSIFVMGAYSGAGLDRALDFSNSLRNATAEIDGNTASVSVRI